MILLTFSLKASSPYGRGELWMLGKRCNVIRGARIIIVLGDCVKSSTLDIKHRERPWGHTWHFEASLQSMNDYEFIIVL